MQNFAKKNALLGPALLTFFFSLTANIASAEPAQGSRIKSASQFQVLPHRQRVAPQNRLLNERLEHLLPDLMQQAKLDMWLVINREYAEDPVYFSLVPQPTFAARRTTMLVFNRLEDGSVEKLSVNTYPFGDPYQSYWSGGDIDAQWQALAQLIEEKKPDTIGINQSTHWPEADGLTKGLYDRLTAALPDRYVERLQPAEQLVVRWLETRTQSELSILSTAVSLARGVIAEAFSASTITPDATTTDDVAWYIRQRFEELGLDAWFMPYVTFQRTGNQCTEDMPFCSAGKGLIKRGDVLHTDVGICYLSQCTDTQEMAYVLKLNEQSAPDGLKNALRTGNKWQDLLTQEFITGRSGNEILAATRSASQQANIDSSTYTHPIGFFGHAPGPTIGMWDNQGPTKIKGDWLLYPDTAYAIEGNIKQVLPEWDNQTVQIMLEQTAYFDGSEVIYAAGRQTQWHLIR